MYSRQAALILVAFVILAGGYSRVEGATRPATEADLAAMRAAGIPNPVVGMPWDPDDPIVGKQAGEVKEWLKARATRNANISCLNPEFAKRLKAFMEAVPGGPPKITDGYRGNAAQERARSSGASHVGACGSYHNFGLAADFNNENKQTLLWMRQNAPRFGLTRLPAMSVETGCSLAGSSFCDPAHIQIQGGKTGQCGLCANDKGEGALLDTGSRSGSPSSQLSNALRNFINPQPQQPPPTYQQPIYPSEQPFRYVDQPTSTPISTIINVNTTPVMATSAAELIREIADPSAATTSAATSSPVILNPNISSVASIQTSVATPTQEVTFVIQPTFSQQTFRSDDLSNFYSEYTPTQQSTFYTLLEEVRRQLEYALSYLQPFGGRPQSGQIMLYE